MKSQTPDEDRFDMKHALFTLLVIFAVVLLASANVSAHPQVPGAVQKKPVVLINATIHPISGPAIEKGFLWKSDRHGDEIKRANGVHQRQWLHIWHRRTLNILTSQGAQRA